MTGMFAPVPAPALEPLMRRLDQEIRIWWQAADLWLGRRSESEQLVIVCALVLALLLLIIRFSFRDRAASGGSQFGGSVVMIMIFAFGLGWMFDSGAGSLSFVFQ